MDTAVADKLMADLEAKLSSLAGNQYGDYKVEKAYPFIYNDPVDGSSTKNGLIISFTDGSRIVYRLSGTGSSGATLRIYLENFNNTDFNENPRDMLEEILEIAMEIAELPSRTGKNEADVIT